MKISQLFLGLVACSTAFAYAGIDGISSNESNIKIGAAANASHPGGVAAVSVQAAGAPYNAFTGFSSLKGLAQAFAAQGTSNTNVTVGSKTFNISHIPVSAMPPSHSALGNFNFGQVAHRKSILVNGGKRATRRQARAIPFTTRVIIPIPLFQPRVLQLIPLQGLTALEAIC